MRTMSTGSAGLASRVMQVSLHGANPDCCLSTSMECSGNTSMVSSKQTHAEVFAIVEAPRNSLEANLLSEILSTIPELAILKMLLNQSEIIISYISSLALINQQIYEKIQIKQSFQH